MSVHSTAAANLEGTAQTLRGLPLGLTQRARRVAAIAAAHAGDVDLQGRFPEETFAALRAEGLLGVQVPVALGGEGATISEVAEVCFILAGACGSSGMIFAMHQVKLACLVRHALESPWHRDFLSRVADRQLLLASSTTEGQRGGDVRASEAPILEQDGRIVLKRDASVISYGLEADAIVTTARRHPDAAPSDQVLVVFEKGDCVLERTQGWDTLGMRGTRSLGFILTAEGLREQVVPVSYDVIHADTMSPTAHLLWSATWAGVAHVAVERARLHTRKAVRKTGGAAPFGLQHYLSALSALKRLRALLCEALERFERVEADSAMLRALDYQTSVALLKVEVSDLAVDAVMSALRATGLAGYRNDGDASIGRQLRDILSAPLMISNDRILANVGLGALLSESPGAPLVTAAPKRGARIVL